MGPGDILICRGCNSTICDRYIMRVGDGSYHERCLMCCICRTSLSHTCFARDSKIFCRLDYERLYGRKCLGCGEAIETNELVMRASEAVFHIRCFLCVVCGVRLQKGDQFVVKQGQLFCRPDYEKEVEMFQGSFPGEIPSGDEMLTVRPTDGRRGPKRPRTILTTQQRRAFKASFEISPKPCRKVREGLAKDTGLSVRIVQVWFQNQRAKVKKIQKKARMDAKNNNGARNEEIADNVKNERIKDEEHSRGYLGDSCSDSEGMLTPLEPQDYSCHSKDFSSAIKDESLEKEETSFYKNMYGTINQTLGSKEFAGIKSDDSPIYEPLPPAQLAVSSFHNSRFFLRGDAPLPIASNPIDRLYSMQNSYFCHEEAQADND
ncbi:LIM domain [Nesidiocoris tenuis]|uniref:LIM domain n=2 Tax=Nesidiocoris tenuis TaxID=355587 RepID=A0ABN7B5W7_9HEMI|nr:LIM domain [Nesidiocoris tenuis]